MKKMKINFSNIENITQTCGTKATTLRNLYLNGINVPEFVCVDVCFFLKYYDIENMNSFYSSSKYKKIKHANIRLDIDSLPKSFEKCMVRSSIVPNGEYDDDFASSISGAYDSVLSENTSDLNASIFYVWESAFSKKALEQHQLCGDQYNIKGMGVIIQQYIEPKISGLFHTGKDDKIDINWINGHLSDLVSGNKKGNNISCYKNKLGECILSGVEDSILGIIDNNLEEAFEKLLNCAIVMKEMFDYSIEVEWIYDGNQIWIVQSQKLI